jgi:hypothetical protein
LPACYILPRHASPHFASASPSYHTMSTSLKETPDVFTLKALWSQLKSWFLPDQTQNGLTTVDPRLHMLHTHNITKSQRLRRRTITAYELPDATVRSNVCVASY